MTITLKPLKSKLKSKRTLAPSRLTDDPLHSPHRWTREEYHKMIAAGIFDEARVELLDGEIWNMAGQLTPHATSVRKTTLFLRDIFDEGFLVDSQLPVGITPWSEPEPDVAVVIGAPDDYADHHPGVDEILLLVEISDTSIRKDRTKKAKSYAQAGVTEYWIVNLAQQQLEVYRQPTPEGLYLDIKIYSPSETVKPLASPGGTIAVADLLPPVKKIL